MPFSSQPRKKGVQVGQEESKDSSCQNHSPQPKTPAQKAELAEEKKKILSLREKVADRFQKDPRASQKAATILSLWINKKK